jgi:hypothetical protein
MPTTTSWPADHSSRSMASVGGIAFDCRTVRTFGFDAVGDRDTIER